MIKSILIIDDERIQAESLSKSIQKEKVYINCFVASEENEILSSIENLFFDVAIVDLRMDNYEIDGFSIIGKIIEINPFARIIIVSAYTEEYIYQINNVFLTGKIIGLIEKKEYNQFVSEIVLSLSKYEEAYYNNPSETAKALTSFYANAKNETNTYQKGIIFEQFVALMLSNMGFSSINKRVLDRSQNEVDLVLRNEIKDNFFSKFAPYILVECKNKPNDPVGKNDFIQFFTKLKNTNGLSNLGFLITTGYIARTTYIEAVRTSSDSCKIIFISNPEIERLINSSTPLLELKKIIDEQVKDN
jgi:CheY-like chemotaxis protein